MECLLPSRSLTLLPCEHPSCAPLIAHVQPCAHPNCAGTIATLNHSWHTRCRVRFETRLLSAVKLTQHVRTRCGSSLSPLIDIVQPSPAAGRGWHVLHTTTTCGAISDGSAPATVYSLLASGTCAIVLRVHAIQDTTYTRHKTDKTQDGRNSVHRIDGPEGNRGNASSVLSVLIMLMVLSERAQCALIMLIMLIMLVHAHHV